MADVFLQPGELVTTQSAMRVKTVVGSCLAIMVRFPRLQMTAIAHCLLPEAGAAPGALPREQALRYVDTTIDLILSAFTKQGVAWRDLEVKLFGGADGLGGAEIQSAYQVGFRNVEAAHAILAARGLNAGAGSLGGSRGRLLEFDTGTGRVLVTKLPGRNP